MVGVINWVLVYLLGKQRNGVTNEQMSNMLCQQFVHSTLPKFLVEVSVIHNLSVIILSAGKVAVYRVIARLGDDEFVLLQRLRKTGQEEKK